MGLINEAQLSLLRLLDPNSESCYFVLNLLCTVYACKQPLLSEVGLVLSAQLQGFELIVHERNLLTVLTHTLTCFMKPRIPLV